MKFLFPIAFALLGSEMLLNLFDFEYKVFSEPFNMMYLMIDVGVFVGLWWIGELLVKHFFNRKGESATVDKRDKT